jgi:hypothetical protein
LATVSAIWEADAKRGVLPAGIAVTPAPDLQAISNQGDGAQ